MAYSVVRREKRWQRECHNHTLARLKINAFEPKEAWRSESRTSGSTNRGENGREGKMDVLLIGGDGAAATEEDDVKNASTTSLPATLARSIFHKRIRLGGGRGGLKSNLRSSVGDIDSQIRACA